MALCGRTGSGKSSLLGALSRLYPIDSGAIVVDGIDWCRAPLAQVRRAVRVVAQEALLLEGTLLTNLLAFSPDSVSNQVRPPASLAVLSCAASTPQHEPRPPRDVLLPPACATFNPQLVFPQISSGDRRSHRERRCQWHQQRITPPHARPCRGGALAHPRAGGPTRASRGSAARAPDADPRCRLLGW